MVLPGNISDKSWNQAGYEGLMRVKTELGFEVAYSVRLSMNVLVLDPKTICVEASEVPQQEQLDKLGVEVPDLLWQNVMELIDELNVAL